MDLNIKIDTPEKENIEIPSCILDGVNERFVLREYQEEAIKRFTYYLKNKSYYQKDVVCDDMLFFNKNHLLFNIATGGGKTLLMACVILYLYNEYGYNNFLFLSHLNSINIKTIDNFFNKNSSKYLFSKNVNIRQSECFDFVENVININVGTYQSLASLLKTCKENAFNLEDVKNKKIVIIADESHHLNAGVDKESGEWENAVNRVLNNNDENFLLEWTATINWNDAKLKNKYSSKCLYKYDLREFYKSGYTKTISLLQRDVENDNLMLGAVILNKYRECLFNEIGINVKPVILFKSKTIADSLENHKKFNELIDELDDGKIKIFFDGLDDGSVTKVACEYLINKYNNLVELLKMDFVDGNIINTNNDKEIDENAVLLNTLENKNNNKRVIFSVDKLNEGWDVLNLFDIVKLYTTQSKVETVRDAQLIGRGARYCGFEYKNREFGKRKFYEFDKYGILEQLYFHSSQDNLAISKLKDELESIGIKIKNKIEIKMKENIKNKMQIEKVFCNKKELKNLVSNDYDIYEDIRLFLSNKIYDIKTNKEVSFNLMDKSDIENKVVDICEKEILLSKIDTSIKLGVIFDNVNYNFEKLYKRLQIWSFEDFIKMIDSFDVKVKNWTGSRVEQYNLYSWVLDEIYNKIISKEVKAYCGSKTFNNKKFLDVFSPYIIKTLENKELIYDEEFLVYDKADFTSEEEDFVKFFKIKIYDKLKEKYDNVYLVRNEKKLKLFQFDNNDTGFEPDFVLFFKSDNVNYQVYIEPKGNNLIGYDCEKEVFLKQITKLTQEDKINLEYNKGVYEENKSYKLFGLSFYNKEKEDKENIINSEFCELFLNK